MRSRGFTLIELLIVVAIIAILAAIAVPNFLEAQTRAKVSRALADMRSMTTAIESYYVDHNTYPPIFVMAAWYGGGTGSGPSVFGTGMNGVSARFIPFTTPIAYITSVFPEAFAVQGVAATGGPNGPTSVYDTFDFIVAKEFYDGTLSAFDEGAAATSGGAWRLSSVGPDRIQAFGGRFVSDGPNFAANQLGADYDPTNGTVSAGDVVRVGPAAPITNDEPFYNRIGEYAQ
jgi:prepilin-type N-terminal cleavage/methylation domain-containing protein